MCVTDLVGCTSRLRSIKTIWRQDEAKLADGPWEGGLKQGASGKEAEADVEQLACPATVAAAMTRGGIAKQH